MSLPALPRVEYPLFRPQLQMEAHPTELGHVPAAATISRFALVADDDQSTREILSHYLRKMGFGCVLAHDGRSALNALRTAKVQVIICDLEMPGMNGLELIDALRAGPQWLIPIVALSGHPGMLEKAEMVTAAALCKPIRYATLEAVIRRLT